MDNNIEIAKPLLKDSKNLALLHKQGIPTGFLSKQPLWFLEALYRYLISNEIVYVAKDSNKIIGFVAGSVNTQSLYKKFLKTNYLVLFRFMVKNIFSYQFIRKVYETFLAPKKTKIENDNLPELLSIVVDIDYYGKGIGRKLVNLLEKEFKSQGFDKYKVIVGDSLEANKFYKSLGFKLYKKIELHKGDISNIYIKNLGDLNG